MAETDFISTEFNLGIVLGMALSFLPLPLVEHLLNRCMRRLDAHCPNLRGRLADANGKCFALVMVDMPFTVLMRIKNGSPACVLLSKHNVYSADVSIHATSQKLLALLEGKEDGDALFFSRHLQVSGDTEALLILRNALDSEPVNLREILYSVFGPFEDMARRISKPVESVGMRLARDIQQLHHALIQPLTQRQHAFTLQLQQMEKRLAVVENTYARRNARKVGDNA